MALYFISGVSGTGKTTLMHELRNRGEEAHDTDVDCIRRSKRTGEPLDYERAKIEGYDWIYPSESLKRLKTQSITKDVFLLGSIDNFDEVVAIADEYIWMTIPLNVLVERLDKREKEYGKSDSERQSILALYERMSAAIDPGLFTLDATKSVESIADDLLDHFRNRSSSIMEEEKLEYGFVSSPVKIGNTVRRQTGPWTPTIHALLDYLHTHDFDYSPTVEGIDDKNREILTFIPGKAVVRPWPQAVMRTDGIEQAGRLLRTYHDIVEGFVPAADAEWRIGRCELKPGQIIRHGDLGSWNTIWQDDKLTALIDWDFAQPGNRVDDLAQMAYYFVPLRGETGWAEAGFTERPDMAQRLRVLVESYSMFSPEEVIEALFKLLEQDREIVGRLGKDGMEPWASFLKRGDVEESQNNSDWLLRVKQELLS